MGVTKALTAVMFAFVLALASACSAVSGYRIASSPTPRPRASTHVVPLLETAKSSWINGVVLSSMGDLKSWDRATAEHPELVAFFGRFGAPFPLWALQEALATRAVPLFQIDPTGISLAAIVHGAYDRQLRSYGAAIRSLDEPVFLSFGHEMNGVWYTWGCGQTSPELFRQAWRHVHSVIRAPQVQWVWTVNDVWSGDPCGLRSWYPGAAYVNWIGIDGYLRPPVDTFGYAFDRTLGMLHRIAPRTPILLAETGISWGPNWSQRIHSLYAGAHRAGLRGILYFDGETSNGDYRPQDHPASLAAFRKALRMRASVVKVPLVPAG